MHRLGRPSKLTVTTELCRHVGLDNHNAQTGRTQALVTTGARIAKYRPTLHKNIWRYMNGYQYESVHDQRFLVGGFQVDIVASGFEMHLNRTMTKLDAWS